ncbi:hypothetical protein, partial [Aneurinibacillus sp. UBA3580]|uniref:hypothetical protein n=1 Tax=Aneurinibacillus sp. UBA3580 TaxID=1946041 RepID=UPI00257C4EEC
FFPIEITSSFSSLFSFVPQKQAALLMIFMSGLRLKSHEGFISITSCGRRAKSIMMKTLRRLIIRKVHDIMNLHATPRECGEFERSFHTL